MHARWLTDIHLNFLDDAERHRFLETVRTEGGDALLLSGDIGEAPNVGAYLEEMANCFPRPIYFVLGNHDFYRSSLAEVRERTAALTARIANLTWLPEVGIVELTPYTCLIGHEGWGDARLGDFERSEVVPADFLAIKDLMGLEKAALRERLHALGDEAADHFRALLPGALKRYQQIVVLTHVPPFLQASWYRGRISEDDWLPHFTCKAAGDVLREAMIGRPDRNMLVLCGHTHGAGETHILHNLKVLTGKAKYGRPEIQRVLEFD